MHVTHGMMINILIDEPGLTDEQKARVFAVSLRRLASSLDAGQDPNFNNDLAVATVHQYTTHGECCESKDSK